MAIRNSDAAKFKQQLREFAILHGLWKFLKFQELGMDLKMPVTIISKANFLRDHPGRAEELVRLEGQMALLTAAHTPYGKETPKGACRAIASSSHFIKPEENCCAQSINWKSDPNKTGKHAEEQVLDLMRAKAATPVLNLMYIDIEPCHDDRYPGHGCKLMLEHAFTTGFVVYGQSQEEYESGTLAKTVRRPEVQDQALIARHKAGLIDMTPLGRGRAPAKR